MLKRIVSEAMLALLLIGIIASNSQPAKASVTMSETIYIKADGSIEPSDAPITTVDKVNYTLTDDISIDPWAFLDYGIVIERDDIILDGQVHSIEGVKSSESKGVFLDGISNVTIINLQVKKFYYGIYIKSSSNITVIGANITESYYGIYLEDSSNNTISENNITNSRDAGVYLSDSSSNSISGNNITNNTYGVRLSSSSNNSISGNNITNNAGHAIEIVSSSYNSIIGNNVTGNQGRCVLLDGASNNTIYNNYFVNNCPNSTREGKTQAYFYSGGQNFWDNGTIGNYWSDYKGWDGVWIFGFIFGKDGIGDQPYQIATDNIDHYPLTTNDPPPDIRQIAAVVIIAIAVVGISVFIRRRRKKA